MVTHSPGNNLSAIQSTGGHVEQPDWVEILAKCVFSCTLVGLDSITLITVRVGINVKPRQKGGHYGTAAMAISLLS